MITISEELSVIKGFLRLMSERTGSNHNIITGLLSGILAERLGIESERLYLGGLLHDIGGIGIFENIITEPLFLQEWLRDDEEMVFHPEVSYRMVKEFLGIDIIEIKEHHELFNGEGYPGQKAGSEVSVGGYIIGISDKFEILSRSSYYNYQEVKKVIKEWKDRWFPGDIVEELLCLLSEDMSLLYDIQQSGSLEKRIMDFEKSLDFTHLTIEIDKLCRFFSMAITLKHPYTIEHSERVSRLSVIIGGQVGLQGDDLRRLELSAYLHDIGKVVIPRGVLNKPTVLTPQEARIIKEHTLKTYEILNNSFHTEDIAFIASSHHEAMDGTGYPLGLKDREIPFLSRIINIADIYDALTSSRAYRGALSKEEAIKIIYNEFKERIDMDLFEVLKKIIKEL